jgi:DNA adenine methylase
VHRRLDGVYVECLDYPDFVRLYDGPETLFYLDPPYWGHERDYGAGLFARADFARLAELLAGLKGRFLLSLNDVPEIRRLFRWARLERAPVTYTIGGRKRVSELVIASR